jgi:hypothetical protein
MCAKPYGVVLTLISMTEIPEKAADSPEKRSGTC